jgi:hypothetical protein
LYKGTEVLIGMVGWIMVMVIVIEKLAGLVVMVEQRMEKLGEEKRG